MKATAHELDEERFVLVDSVEDVLFAEGLMQVLEDRGIPALSRPRRAGTVDVLTTANLPWWEILVPEEYREEAQTLLATERTRLIELAQEAAQSAEEEERESEESAKAQRT